MSHLNKDQLLAFRDGESDDPRVREHLATCAECQRAFDDSRWRLALMRLAAAKSDHPSSDQMLAFWQNAISGPRAKTIQQHLRGCNRCLAVYRRLRGSDPKMAYASPGMGALRSVQRRYSSGASRVRELGTLVLRRIGEGLGLELSAADGFGAGLEMECDLTLGAPRATPMASSRGLFKRLRAPHPSSARARRERLIGDDETLDSLAEAAGAAGAAEAPQASRPEPAPGVVVDAGWLRLELEAHPREGDTLLTIRALSAESGEAVPGVRLALRSESGDSTTEVTDDTGRAGMRFPEGTSKLEVQDRDPMTLMLVN